MEAIKQTAPVTLLFTDVEGSTRLLQRAGDGYAELLQQHRQVLRAAVAAHGGWEVGTDGDGFFAVFGRAADAVAAAADAQIALGRHPWPEGCAPLVRMGVHTGKARVLHGDYVGLDVHRAARVMAAGHGGQVLVSAATRTQLDDRVRCRDLGRHRLKDLPQPEHLYQLVIDGVPGEFPPLRTLGGDHTDLPSQPNAFVGRCDELAALAALVSDTEVRLLTLVGPGGVGKTRLAIEVASLVAADFRDGVRFVGLASVQDPRDVGAAIVRALALAVQPGEGSARDALVGWLRDRHLLLLVDNLEHVLDAADLLGEIVAACPGVTLLASSRAATFLRAERLFVVRPLDVPDSAIATPDDVRRSGAGRLFCDWARARDPDFALDDDSAQHVGTICRKLDGLPLALELAAARSPLLEPSELAKRLDRALAVLVNGARDAPPRQQTLRATIDWSLRLLTTEEQAAFARLGVFADGMTIDAAEQVACAPLHVLDSLATKHLIHRRGARLFMPRTVREYALERLAVSFELDAAHGRLAEWCLTFLGTATPRLVQVDRGPCLTRIDAEMPNALSALAWAIESCRAETALRLVGALGTYWRHTRRHHDGLPWVDAALALGGNCPTSVIANAHLTRAHLVDVRYASHAAALHRALTLFRACADREGIATCLGLLAYAEAWVGRDEHARRLADEAIRIANRTGAPDCLARALMDRALVPVDYEDAVRLADIANAHLRRAGDLVAETRLCTLTGVRAVTDTRYRDALTWFDTALLLTRRLDRDAHAIWHARCNQGLAWLFLDELDEAADAFTEALALCRVAHREDIVGETLLGLAVVRARRGERDLAARLAGAARTHQDLARSSEEDVIWNRLWERLDAVRASDDSAERWSTAERAGANLTWDQALELALAERPRSAADPARRNGRDARSRVR